MAANPLRDLARFIAAKDSAEEHAEIRVYAVENAADLAPAFGVTMDRYREVLVSEPDDSKLARRLLTDVKAAGATRRDLRATERACVAQQTADAVSRSARWDGLAVSVDVAAVLASALTGPADVLVFDVGDVFPPVVVPMRLLMSVARLKRRGLWGFVDAAGLHLRYPNACGGSSGFNFRSQHELLPQKGRCSSKPAPETVVLHVAPSRCDAAPVAA